MPFDLSYANLQLVLLFLQIIDILKQLDVLLHDQRLLLFVRGLILQQQVTKIRQTNLFLLALFRLFPVLISIADLLPGFSLRLNNFFVVINDLEAAFLLEILASLFGLLFPDLKIIILFFGAHIDFVKVNDPLL